MWGTRHGSRSLYFFRQAFCAAARAFRVGSFALGAARRGVRVITYIVITRRWRRSLVFGETRPTTPLVAGPPTAPAVAAEGASCAARAVPSDSVSCMLAARRVPTGRFADGVPGAGREPSASVMTKREQRGSVSPATRLQRSQEIWVTTIRLSSARMGAFLLAAAEAATALGTGGGHGRRLEGQRPPPSPMAATASSPGGDRRR